MALKITSGNLTAKEANRLATASVAPSEGLAESADQWECGSTEPWISRLVADWIVAIGARTVLEAGSYIGGTSVWIYDALRRLGGGDFHVCEIDQTLADRTMANLGNIPHAGEVVVTLHVGDVLEYLTTTREVFDLAWVDDNHEKPHVAKELEALMPRMAPGGLILMHDVWGSWDLHGFAEHYGGVAIDLPRVSTAGGLGIIQVGAPRRRERELAALEQAGRTLSQLHQMMRGNGA